MLNVTIIKVTIFRQRAEITLAVHLWLDSQKKLEQCVLLVARLSKKNWNNARYLWLDSLINCNNANA
jgi:hypothetical protein